VNFAKFGCNARAPPLKRWLKSGVMKGTNFQKTEKGTPQGGPISVLLSNVYLHFVLDLWLEKVVKTRFRGKIHFVRYYKDFVICFECEDDATRVLDALQETCEVCFGSRTIEN